MTSLSKGTPRVNCHLKRPVPPSAATLPGGAVGWGGEERRAPRPVPHSPPAPGPRNNRWSLAAVLSAGSAGRPLPSRPGRRRRGAAIAGGEKAAEGRRRPHLPPASESTRPWGWRAPPPPLSLQPHTKRWRPGPAGRGCSGLRCRREESTARGGTHHEVPGEVVLPIVVRTLHGLDPLYEFPQDLHLLHPPESPRLRSLAPPPPSRPAQSPLSLPQLAPPTRPLSPDPRRSLLLPTAQGGGSGGTSPAPDPTTSRSSRRSPTVRGEPLRLAPTPTPSLLHPPSPPSSCSAGDAATALGTRLSDRPAPPQPLPGSSFPPSLPPG